MGNLHSLECMLRLYLRRAENNGAIDAVRSLDSLRVGDVVPETAFTNYDTLAMMVGKYNAKVGPAFQVDAKVVELRDALAHGRVYGSASTRLPMRLLKFDKPRSGQATVTYSELLDQAWLDAKRAWVAGEIEKVAGALGGVFE